METWATASIATLAVFDTCRAVERSIIISQTQVLEKAGGKFRDWKF